MDPEDFNNWRVDEMGYTQTQAAVALGVSKGTVINYEAGKRREDGRPVVIPKYIALACAAIAAKLKPWGEDGAKPASNDPWTPSKKPAS